MNDNYLWDRSGEPEPEIQQLEELLGTLRYEPRPLQIPANFKIGRRLNYFRPMAVAATLLLFAIAISLWVNFYRRPQHVASKAAAAFETPVVPQSASVAPEELKPAAVNDTPKSVRMPKRHAVPQPALLAANRARREPLPEPALTSEELAQKDQVLLALRLVSTKLNMAQRKLQGGTAPNVIRNQHRIG